MNKVTKIVLLGLISAALLAGCSEPAAPVNSRDAAVILENQSNTLASAEIIPDVPAGVYPTGDEPASVTLTWNKSNGLSLRYTYNCSVPSEASDESADGTIELNYKDSGDGASYQSVIRCALFDENGIASDVYTFVYIHAPEDRFTMPIISIVSAKENFYSNFTGILVPGKLRSDALKNGNPSGWQPWYDNANYYQRGIEWERPAALSVFDENGILQLYQNCGVRVSGGFTRSNIQKSLRLYARRSYTSDTGVFEYSFWGDLRGSHTGTPVSFSDTVLLRGGSNNESNAIFTTPSLLMLLEGTSVDCPAITPVVEYINGKYMGILTQLEDFDGDYFLAHYGIAAEDLTTMKGTVGELLVPGGWHVDDGTAEEESEFIEMIKFIINSNMEKSEKYEKACEMIDIRNFIEYVAFEAFIGNTDWPQNNMRAWRYNANGYDPDAEGVFDGRWRFLPKDLDLSFGYGNESASANPYSYMKGSCALYIKNMYTSLMRNDEFSDLFYTYMCTLSEAVVTPERCEKIFDLMQVYTAREVAYSISALGVAGGSRGNWNAGFDVMRNYSISRASSVLRHTKSESNRSLASITVNYDIGGTVKLGWYEVGSGDARSYLRDTRIPLEILPEAEYIAGDVVLQGCHFDENGYLIADSSECIVTISFVKSEAAEAPASGIVINEVMFRNTCFDWIELYNTSSEEIVMSGWALGKSENPAKAHTIDNTVIEPGGFALICCTDYSNSDGIEGLRVPMSLGNGDTLYLFDQNGTAADSLMLETPSKTVHLGRVSDGGDIAQLSKNEATPGSSNFIEQYCGTFSSAKFEPYLLAWGRAYDIDDYFYEKDGVLCVNNATLMELCRGADNGLSLYRLIRKHDLDIPLEILIEESSSMEEASVRYVEELKSVIIG